MILKNKIKKWPDDEIYILTDFDRTITDNKSEVSWGILSKCSFVPEGYVKDREKIHNFYRQIELDEQMDKELKNKYMEKWGLDHLNLFVKHKITKEMIEKATQNLEIMKFRKGAEKFLKNMHDKNIPVIILSAGIGNFIVNFLKQNNCDYDNVYVISNFLNFEDNIASGIKGDMLHSFNKNEDNFKEKINNIIKDRSKVIVLGDSTYDAKMTNKKDALKIGFLDEKIEENMEAYKKTFDIVCVNNVSFDELMEEIGRVL